MTADLYRIFRVAPQYLRKPPSHVTSGGIVFVMEHRDGLENYYYFSVNHQSTSGELGWQSQRLYTRSEADAAAEVLGEYLCAEVQRGAA